MNRREKILAALAGAMVVGFAAYGAVNKLVLQPIRTYDARANDLREERD